MDFIGYIIVDEHGVEIKRFTNETLREVVRYITLHDLNTKSSEIKRIFICKHDGREIIKDI